MLRMDSKKILLLIVLTTLAMTFFIYSINVFALSVPNISESSVKIGHPFTVSGVSGDVTSGGLVEIYWDIVEGLNAHKIGEGYGASDGSYSIDVIALKNFAGSHYVWARAYALPFCFNQVFYIKHYRVDLMIQPNQITLLTSEIGIGGVGGFCIGYSIIKIAKILSLIVCFSFIGLQYLNHKGIITINYVVLETWINSLLVETNVIHEIFVSRFVQIPVGLGFILIIGIKKG